MMFTTCVQLPPRPRARERRARSSSSSAMLGDLRRKFLADSEGCKLAVDGRDTPRASGTPNCTPYSILPVSPRMPNLLAEPAARGLTAGIGPWML